jgi:hyperosmotically inducible periplasmic protein
MSIFSRIASAVLLSLVLGFAGCAHDNSNSNRTAGEVVSDSWITSKIKTDVLVHKPSSIAKLHVKTRDGVVTLSGTANSQEDLDRAIEEVNSVKGVKQVVNNVEVKQ